MRDVGVSGVKLGNFLYFYIWCMGVGFELAVFMG